MMFPAGFLQLCHRIPGQEPPTDVGGLIATERNVQHWPFCWRWASKKAHSSKTKVLQALRGLEVPFVQNNFTRSLSIFRSFGSWLVTARGKGGDPRIPSGAGRWLFSMPGLHVSIATPCSFMLGSSRHTTAAPSRCGKGPKDIWWYLYWKVDEMYIDVTAGLRTQAPAEFRRQNPQRYHRSPQQQICGFPSVSDSLFCVCFSFWLPATPSLCWRRVKSYIVI